MILVLHNIRSSHNVGSLFRTADAAGFQEVYCCGITPAPLDEFNRVNSRLAKVSLGAERFLAWKRVKSTTALLDRLKKGGRRVYALEQSRHSVPYSEVTLSASEFEQACLVVGNEIKGLSSGVLKRADVILDIPMFGKKESLNVSVAFGIVAFHLRGYT